MPYEKLWENLSHKKTSTLFVVPELSSSVDSTAWEWEFSKVHYCESIQRQIESLSHADPFYFYRAPLSNAGVILKPREIRTHYWQDFPEIKNLRHAEVLKPTLPRPVGGTAEIKEEGRSLYFHETSLSDGSVVPVNVAAGTAITDLTSLKNAQIQAQKREISERFDIIAQREDDWDGYGSQKPTNLTLAHARKVMEALLDAVISNKHSWLAPFICSDEDGYIIVEWYKGKRSLCFDIQEDEVRCTKIWQTSANTNTHTASLNQGNYLKLWEWFLDE